MWYTWDIYWSRWTRWIRKIHSITHTHTLLSNESEIDRWYVIRRSANDQQPLCRWVKVAACLCVRMTCVNTSTHGFACNRRHDINGQYQPQNPEPQVGSKPVIVWLLGELPKMSCHVLGDECCGEAHVHLLPSSLYLGCCDLGKGMRKMGTSLLVS